MGDNVPAFWEALGRAIKVERTARGLGRRELAGAAELSYPYLSEIENGTKQPSSKALLLIARALGISASELLQVAETWTEGSAAREPGRSRWFSAHGAMAMEARSEEGYEGRRRALLRELLEELGRLPTEDLERLRNLARELRA